MLDKDINQLIDCYTQVLRPKRAMTPLDNPTIIAVDTEFDNDGLISLSLSAKTDYSPLTCRQNFVLGKPTLTVEELLGLVMEFCKKYHVEVNKTVYLLSHFAQAELQHIEDLWKQLKIRVFNKSMYADYDGDVKLRIIDTFAHLMCGLDKVARSVGMEKVSLDGIDGKSEKYWKENMRQLLKEHRDIFERYAIRDSEVLIEAFQQKRQFFIENFGIDILRMVTLAHTAQNVFTTEFLKEAVEPCKFEWLSYQKNMKGTWKTQWKRAWMYDGSRDKRYFAMKCYWGGRREAFIRGFLDEPTEIWDVKQMYPTMSRLPLPNQNTKWIYREGIGLSDLEEAIGFVHCTFAFPQDLEYPCLPVFDSRFPKLMFPLTGETWCTTYEIELAERLEAEFSNVEAWVFYPTESEQNHPLKKYMEHFTRLKNENPEGSMPYETAKLLMNSLIGKFCQRDTEYSVETYQNMLENLDYDYSKFQQILKNVELRQKYKNPLSVGSCWEPEWSSLILGSSRAIISEIMHTTQALTGHTDSVMTRKGSKTHCHAVDVLHSLGSDLEHKTQYDAESFWICRSAVYSPIRNGTAIKPTHHGYPCNTHEDFGKIIMENLLSGKSVLNQTRKVHLTTPKEALRKRAKLNSQTVRTTQINWDWDYKRKLQQPRVNIWRDYSLSKPWKSLQILLKEPTRKQGKPQKRTHNVSMWQKLHLKGWSDRQIGKKFHVHHTTVRNKLANLPYIEIEK